MVNRWPRFLAPVLLVASVLSALAPAAERNDEDAVKTLLQNWVDASKRNDVDALLLTIAPDARIDSTTARAKVSKEFYAAALKEAHNRGRLGRTFEGKITSLAFHSPERAVLEIETKGESARKEPQTSKLRWTLIKREGRWLILETEYLR